MDLHVFVLLAILHLAMAGTIAHSHAFGMVRSHTPHRVAAQGNSSVVERGTIPDVTQLGAKPGINAQTPSSNAWLGTDGPYTNEFTNDSGEALVLVCWGPEGSWVNAVPPLITYTLAPDDRVTVSYAEGAAGACSAVYADTTMDKGQIYNTWLEYTFAGIYSTYDVSREVNMNGRAIETIGPSCTTNMDTCVFRCQDANATSCEFGYELINCHAGNGGGSGVDESLDAASGGCNGLTGGAGALKTSLM